MTYDDLMHASYICFHYVLNLFHNTKENINITIYLYITVIGKCKTDKFNQVLCTSLSTTCKRQHLSFLHWVITSSCSLALGQSKDNLFIYISRIIFMKLHY